MNQDVCYRINRPQVIDETIEGEAVIIHLATGNYYRLGGSGSVIWSALGAGRTPAEVASAVGQAYPQSSAEVQEGVRTLIDELLGEDLIVATDTRDPEELTSAVAQPGAQFETPRLEKYSDMQDLILIDPVHQVDEQGWPHANPTAVDVADGR